MTVPAFDMRGFLPPFVGADGTTRDRSPYVTKASEMVAAMATSPARENLLFGLLKYRRMLGAAGYTDGIQFVDGSFVENVELRENRDPGDIDVFSFLVRPQAFRVDPAKWAAVGFPNWVLYLMNREKNKQRFRIDSYGIAVDQHGALGIINETIYWYSLFSHKRLTHDWKGFLCVPLNLADDEEALSALIGR
ncbi:MULTISPECIES: DUF6932 family protein [unclassified Bradyrhizobium]|nr:MULTISPECIES: hypothetical protein [unclassified Bradyrhizobium]